MPIFDPYGQPVSSSRGSRGGGHGTRGFSPWFGTQHSPTRRQLFNFSQDPAYQLSPAARVDLSLKAQTLVANTGLAAVLRPLARIIGFLSPQARTGDPGYDAALEAAFSRVANSTLIFDAAGSHNFYSYQVATTEARFVAGEVFSIFTETTTGAARIASRHGLSVSGKPEGGSDAWFDGIRSDPDGFPLSYHFKLKTGGRVLDARSVFHHRHLHALGARRGVTALSHAVNHILDLIEITAHQKTAIKLAAAVAITRKGEAPAGTIPGQTGLSAPISADVFAPPDMAGSEAAAEERPPLGFEEFLQTGLFSSVPLDVLHDERPHPNVMAFRESLMREVAAGLGVAHQLLYFMDDPGGAWSRILLEALVKFIADQYLHHLRPFCQRFWVYTISKEIKAGRLDAPPRGMTPQQMWSVRWTPPRSMTADIGRVGRLSIEMRRALMTTFAAHFEELGLDWEDELQQAAREVAYLRRLEAETEGLQPGDLTGWMLGPGQTAPGAAAGGAADNSAATAAAVEDLRGEFAGLREDVRRALHSNRPSAA